MKKLIYVSVLISLLGCVTTMLPPLVRVKKNTNYKIGEKKKVETGSPIFMAEVLKEVDFYTAAKTFTPPKGGVYWEGEFKAGSAFYVVAQSKDGDVIVSNKEFPEGLSIRIKSNGTVAEATKGELQTSKNGPRGWMMSMGTQRQQAYLGSYAAYAPYSNPNEYIKLDQQTWPLGQLFIKAKTGYPLKGSFKAELIYAGNDGATVRFTYREYMNDLARPAFSQELSYNLKESRTIGYKSVKIKIHGISNSSATYEVAEDGGLPWLPEL